MGLLARSLSLTDWRNFPEQDLGLGQGLTVLVGRNAMGKTNTVEALQLLTAGYSFRRPRPGQLVREGASKGRARLRLEGDGRVVDLECTATSDPPRRHWRRNGKACAPQDLPRTLMSVLFCPDDLSFVKRGASYRRDEIDDFGRQAAPGYSRLLQAYGRAVDQRNRLLKEPYPDLSLLDAWDSSLALGGSALLVARERLFERLGPRVVEVYGQIADGERLSCSYESSLGIDLAGLSREEVRDAFLARLSKIREDELRRQQTLVGPQRDDLAFRVEGRDARSFASQGQQRTIVLAWKMAEVDLAREVVGQLPLLLLDDVMSELDADRRGAMTRFVEEGMQTVVTTTNLGYFPEELLADAEVVHIGE